MPTSEFPDTLYDWEQDWPDEIDPELPSTRTYFDMGARKPLDETWGGFTNAPIFNVSPSEGVGGASRDDWFLSSGRATFGYKDLFGGMPESVRLVRRPSLIVVPELVYNHQTGRAAWVVTENKPEDLYEPSDVYYWLNTASF